MFQPVSRRVGVPLVGARNRLNPLGIFPGVRNGGLSGMPTGTIARLLIDKGFGFIRDEGGIERKPTLAWGVLATGT